MQMVSEVARCRPLAISRIDDPEAVPPEMPSRFVRVSANSNRRRGAGTIFDAATAKPNQYMALARGAPKLMQRLPRLQTAPHVGPLDRGKPHPSWMGHKHHLLEKRFIADGVASNG